MFEQTKINEKDSRVGPFFKKMSMRYWDSNPRPLDLESPPIITRPGLKPSIFSWDCKFQFHLLEVVTWLFWSNFIDPQFDLFRLNSFVTFQYQQHIYLVCLIQTSKTRCQSYSGKNKNKNLFQVEKFRFRNPAEPFPALTDLLPVRRSWEERFRRRQGKSTRLYQSWRVGLNGLAN